MKHFLAFLCFCLSSAGFAQRLTNDSPFRTRNTVYVEALGSGGFYSLNYERLAFLREKQAYGFRLGTSTYGNNSGTLNLIGELFALLGGGSHHADIGIGLTSNSKNFFDGPFTPAQWHTTLYAIPRMSYRYQKPTGGLMLRAGFTPMCKLTNRVDSVGQVSLWYSIAIGYSF